MDCCAAGEDLGDDAPVTTVDKYKLAHQSARKAWDVPANFPEQKVLDEYANPRVDTNKSSFTFHKPDVDILRGYCFRQFNWDQVLPLTYSPCVPHNGLGANSSHCLH